MRLLSARVGRAGFGAATILVASALAGWATPAPPSPFGRSTAAPVVASSVLSTGRPDPWTPTAFAIEKIDRAFPAITSLTSTGDALYWVADGSIWRFSPTDAAPQRVYERQIEDAAIWDIAATDAGFVFSELLPTPAGSWRVWSVSGDREPVELDRGVAEGGAPPTLAIDAQRTAWAGFDESAELPRSFLRAADSASPAARTTLLDVDIESGLLWYPQLDGDSLWYSIIEPDFDGTGSGDAFHIETLDLADPSTDPVRFEDLDRVFEAAVSRDYVAWKSVDPELSALTWGELHLLDRRTNARLVLTGQANHPSIGSRFVAFEEISRQKVMLYDLATRSLVEIPDPLRGAKGTIGLTAVSGNLFAYTVSVKGTHSLYWTALPD
jgi:hypothetical protein